MMWRYGSGRPMRTRHTVIESPLGEMTLVADGDTLTGVYFRQHWHPPTADALGDCVVPATDEVFRSAAVQLHEYLEEPAPALAGKLF